MSSKNGLADTKVIHKERRPENVNNFLVYGGLSPLEMQALTYKERHEENVYNNNFLTYGQQCTVEARMGKRLAGMRQLQDDLKKYLPGSVSALWVDSNGVLTGKVGTVLCNKQASNAIWQKVIELKWEYSQVELVPTTGQQWKKFLPTAGQGWTPSPHVVIFSDKDGNETGRLTAMPTGGYLRSMGEVAAALGYDGVADMVSDKAIKINCVGDCITINGWVDSLPCVKNRLKMLYNEQTNGRRLTIGD